MPHGLDHIVHAVRDLDAAAEFYGRAGFTVGSRNRHPWGTHNRIVQLNGCFIEILEVAEPKKIVPHRARSFSFGAFNRDFLARREGFSMLLLNSRDAAADARAFEAANISNFDVFDFAREGKRPDGTVVKLAFSLAFAIDPNSPHLVPTLRSSRSVSAAPLRELRKEMGTSKLIDLSTASRSEVLEREPRGLWRRDFRSAVLGFAVCQHHFPENFWNPAFQHHPNGAGAVRGVNVVAEEPSRHRDFLTAYAGVKSNVDGSGIVTRTENGDIAVMRPASWQELSGIPVEAGGEGMTLHAVRFAVADLAQTEALHRQNGLVFRRHAERLILAPEQAFGATLIFEAAGA